MKDEVRQIIGKTIKGVITSEGSQQSPKSQVFLMFDDGTYYEFYGNITATGGVGRGESEYVLQYIAKVSTGTVKSYP